MYISLQFIILEILLGLVFLAVLYLMLRGLLKRMLCKELDTIREPINTLADYLVGKAQMEAAAEEMAAGDQGKPQPHPPGQKEAQGTASKNNKKNNNPGQREMTVEPSPEKLPLEPVDVADEFVALKNANRINAYNLRVQKIWELYKSKKINIKQYNEELVRLKKEFNIGMETDASQKDSPDAAAASEKMAPVKKLEPQPANTASKNTNPKKSDENGDKLSGAPASGTGTSSQQKVARKPDDTNTSG